jgi:hypothetical protein
MAEFDRIRAGNVAVFLEASKAGDDIFSRQRSMAVAT